MTDWFALAAERGQLSMAIKSLTAIGAQSYAPQVTRLENWRGRRREISRPLLGSYFLAAFSQDLTGAVCRSRGVRCLLAGRVHPQEIEAIRLVEAQRSSGPGKWDFGPGDVVRITTGPFAWFYAEIVEQVDKHGQVVALVDLLGRKSRCQFDALQLETP